MTYVGELTQAHWTSSSLCLYDSFLYVFLSSFVVEKARTVGILK